jgi:hypothetical protein
MLEVRAIREVPVHPDPEETVQHLVIPEILHRPALRVILQLLLHTLFRGLLVPRAIRAIRAIMVKAEQEEAVAMVVVLEIPAIQQVRVIMQPVARAVVEVEHYLLVEPH